MNFNNEAAIDAKLASLSDDDLRAVTKRALALTATVLLQQKQINDFLHHLAAEFNSAGTTIGRDYEAQVVTQLKALEAIFGTTKTATMQ